MLPPMVDELEASDEDGLIIVTRRERKVHAAFSCDEYADESPKKYTKEKETARRTGERILTSGSGRHDEDSQ